MEHHPDILELRARYERAASTPLAQGVEALAVLAGVYLAISPWVAGFPGFPNLRINNLVTGLAFALLMAGIGSAYERTHGMSWAATLIGVWTIISPWAIAGSVHTTRTITSNVIVGCVMVLLGCAAALSARMDRLSGSGGGLGGMLRRSRSS